jgi:uncharacterized protein (DUF58 family)
MNKMLRSLVLLAISLTVLFILTVGSIIHVDQMYLMALALALLPAAVWASGQILSGGVVCTRSLPALCASGETVPVTLAVTNIARLPRSSIRLSDLLPRGLHAVGTDSLLLLNLSPRESREVIYGIVPERRGRYMIGPVRVETLDPLGFWAFVRRVGTPSELVVYPAPLSLRRVYWEETAASGGYNQETAQRRGNGMEFHGVREYQSGDELRHVHWRTTARRGTLSVAEYAQGANRDTVIALDLGRAAYANTGIGAESALECAVVLAASAAAYLLRRGHAVRLLTPQNWDDMGPPSAGPIALPRILETLVDAEADSSLSLAEMLMRTRQITSAATLVCITPYAADPALGQSLPPSIPVFGLALDPFVTRPERDGLESDLPGLWRLVQRNADLTKILEG